jgi:carboxyl-terminal processing protease
MNLPRRHSGRLCLVLALAAASGCAHIDPYNMIGRQVPLAPAEASSFDSTSSTRLDPEVRAKAFDAVWKTINERYYDPGLNGVDWKAAGERHRPQALAAADDEAFWDALDRMTGEMKDAHTRVDSPRRAELIRNSESITLGFSFLDLEGRLVVWTVHPDSDAWWAGVRPGMVIAAIEGVDAREAYARLQAIERLDSTPRARHFRTARRIVTGEPGSRASITFERADGSRFDASLERRRISTAAAASHRVLPSGFGYVRLTQWTFGATRRAIEGVKELKKTPGMIIDLRSNPGGSLPSVTEMLGHFFTEKTVVGETLTRTGKPVSLLFGAIEIIKLRQEVKGEEGGYTGPVVVLVNSGSGSGSEYFAGAMQAVGRARIVGEPTCGCLLGFLGYAALPGGGQLAYSEVGFRFVNGKRIEGEGVIPDTIVPLALQDLRYGRDRPLEAAQELLRKLGPWKKA